MLRLPFSLKKWVFGLQLVNKMIIHVANWIIYCNSLQGNLTAARYKPTILVDLLTKLHDNKMEVSRLFSTRPGNSAFS